MSTEPSCGGFSTRIFDSVFSILDSDFFETLWNGSKLIGTCKIKKIFLSVNWSIKTNLRELSARKISKISQILRLMLPVSINLNQTWSNVTSRQISAYQKVFFDTWWRSRARKIMQNWRKAYLRDFACHIGNV